MQDLFDLEILPADTDYSMMSGRKYGKLPGMDLIHLLDAYSYHTDRDTVARIQPGTVQVSVCSYA